ncbi:hypothetical protein ElyMa_005509800 [Elysia marginata]|uniref:Uncharacterized protein n=1 Tax=Elysia marginata TaxID=1093978 RepID=A0AAV4ETP2_9GAST|nr:hypothetical protein ElyMa_005509800 [Elysia marginata]
MQFGCGFAKPGAARNPTPASMVHFSLNKPLGNHTSLERSGRAYRPQSEYRRESRDYSRDDGQHFQREGNQDAGKPRAAWASLESAYQKQWET